MDQSDVRIDVCASDADQKQALKGGEPGSLYFVEHAESIEHHRTLP